MTRTENTIRVQLARTMPPERARAWWMRLHIGLNSEEPASVLPEGWIPACVEACILEAFAARGQSSGNENPN